LIAHYRRWRRREQGVAREAERRSKREVGMPGENEGASRSQGGSERVDWAELWAWFAPWLGGAGLVAVGLLGLFVASRAETDGAYVGGFAAAGVAALALAWRIRVAFADENHGAPWPPVLVEEGGALVLLVAVLVVLALFGLFLAARGHDPMATYGGYGLFAGALMMIFWNMKHYFDRLER
jgi:hypothetical protein